MRRGHAVALSTLLVGAGGCERCHKNDDSLTPKDASVDAPSAAAKKKPTPSGPWSARLVARVTQSSGGITELADHTLALRTGLFVHRLDEDGTLATIGSPQTYAPFVPDTNADLSGYDTPPLYGMTVTGRGSQVFVSGNVSRNGNLIALVWDGRAWKKTDERPPQTPSRSLEVFELRVEDDEADAGLPIDGTSWRNGIRLADGGRAWITHRQDRLFTFVEHPQGKARLVPLPKADVGEAREDCTFLESADDGLYLSCAWHPREQKSFEKVLQLENDGWVEMKLPPPAGEGFRQRVHAVDADSGLWVFDGQEELKALRATPDGKVESIELPRASATLARPHYSGQATLSQGAKADSFRNWEVLSITEGREPQAPAWTNAVFPRRSGEVWVLAHERGGAADLYRIARGQQGETTTLVFGSDVDERNEVLNARPLREWVGHCAQLFVTIASALKDGELASEKMTDRMPEIDNIVAKLKKPHKPYALAAAVEGRLGERKVAGVVLARTYPDASEADMEKAATTLVERFTRDPASPPTVTCTLPVLERAVRVYPPTRPE